MSDIRIRRMKPAEAAEAALLERECFPDPWSERSIRTQMDSSCALWLVAEQNGEIVGYLGTQLVLDEGEILRIAVAADRRGEKIGTALLREMLALTPQTNIWNLDVRESNAPAQGLYRKFGFDIIGRRKHYYRDPEEDAVLMQRRRD